MRIRFPALWILGLAAALGLASCGAPPLRPGERHYAPGSGFLTTVVVAPIRKVQRATVDTLKELRLKPMIRHQDAFGGFVAGEIMDQELRIFLKRIDEDTTELRMRVLFSRDRHKIEQVLEDILKRLPSTPRPAESSPDAADGPA